VPKKFAPDKIRVNSIHPGLILTPMLGVVTREELQRLIAAPPLKTRRSAGIGQMVCGLSGQRRSLPLSPAPSLSWTAATRPIDESRPCCPLLVKGVRRRRAQGRRGGRIGALSSDQRRSMTTRSFATHIEEFLKSMKFASSSTASCPARLASGVPAAAADSARSIQASA
jgi:NAD(P)-dependent dehydrogenase (short-subunit alcohol dehydrogenase family)